MIIQSTHQLLHSLIELLHKNAAPFFYDFIKLRDDVGEFGGEQYV